MRKFPGSLLWAGLVAAGVAACGDDVTITPPVAQIHSVTVAPSGVSINVGQSVTLSAAVAADPGVTWTIAWSLPQGTPASVATLSAAGVLTAVGPGSVSPQACASATLSNGQNQTVCGNATITIVQPSPVNALQSFSVTPQALTLTAGQTSGLVTLAATGTPSSGTVTVTYSNSTNNSAVCTVTPTGANPTVTAVAAGNCVVTITATASGAGLTTNSLSQAVSVTVTAQQAALTSLSVTPSNLNLRTGESAGLTAITTKANASVTVTFAASTNNTAICTVAGGTTSTPTVTAVAAGNCVVTITASGSGTGFASNSLSQAVAVVVTQPVPATVSISSVTAVPTIGIGTFATPVPGPTNCTPSGLPEQPVQLTNVYCQINVTLNVNAGDQVIDRVEVLIGGRVMASQTFPGTVASQGGTASASAPVEITQSINTAQLRMPGSLFVPAVYNGNRTISARLFTSAAPSSPIPSSNAIPVVMNNADMAIVQGAGGGGTFTLVNNSSSPSFTTGGVTYFTGTQTAGTINFVSFSRQVPTGLTFNSTVCGTSNSNAINGDADAGITITATFNCVAVEGSNTFTGTPVTLPPTYAAGAIGPDNTPVNGPTCFTNVGTAFSVPAVNGESRWNPTTCATVLPVATASRGIDNKAPSVSLSTVAFNAAWDQPWINSNTQSLLGFIIATDGGSGVASKAARVFATGCPGPDLPDPAGAANLAETVTSTSTDGKRICGRATDNVGNTAVTGASNFFGVDNVAPSARYAGSTGATPTIAVTAHGIVSTLANTTIFGLAAQAQFGVSGPFTPGAVWGIEGQDTRSGFNQNGSVAAPQGPALQSLTLRNPANPAGVTCSIASLSLGTILSDTWVRSTTLPAIDGTSGACAPGQPGYFTYTPTVVDRAGNVGAPSPASRNYAIDQYAAPNITGLGFAAALYTPGGAAPFGFSANDDLEIIDGTLLVTQAIPSGAGTGLRYPLGSLSALGTRWDATITNVLNGAVASIPYFIFRVDETCSALATPYASCPAPGGPPAYITAPKAPTAGDYGAGAGKLPTTVAANVGDVAWQLGGTPISAPMLSSQFSPSTGISQPWTGADLLSWDFSISGSTVTAVHVASTSIVTPLFDNVTLWRLYGTEWVLCGTAPAPVLTDNGAHRFWTYTMTAPSTGPCAAAGGGDFRVMGTLGGAGLFTPSHP